MKQSWIRNCMSILLIDWLVLKGLSAGFCDFPRIWHAWASSGSNIPVCFYCHRYRHSDELFENWPSGFSLSFPALWRHIEFPVTQTLHVIRTALFFITDLVQYENSETKAIVLRVLRLFLSSSLHFRTKQIKGHLHWTFVFNKSSVYDIYFFYSNEANSFILLHLIIPAKGMLITLMSRLNRYRENGKYSQNSVRTRKKFKMASINIFIFTHLISLTEHEI